MLRHTLSMLFAAALFTLGLPLFAEDGTNPQDTGKTKTLPPGKDHPKPKSGPEAGAADKKVDEAELAQALEAFRKIQSEQEDKRKEYLDNLSPEARAALLQLKEMRDSDDRRAHEYLDTLTPEVRKALMAHLQKMPPPDAPPPPPMRPDKSSAPKDPPKPQQPDELRNIQVALEKIQKAILEDLKDTGNKDGLKKVRDKYAAQVQELAGKLYALQLERCQKQAEEAQKRLEQCQNEKDKRMEQVINQVLGSLNWKHDKDRDRPVTPPSTTTGGNK